jgi:hypothetical protein
MLEAEIRRIMVPGQPWKKCLADLISTEESWMFWYTPVIPAMAGSVK